MAVREPVLTHPLATKRLAMAPQCVRGFAAPVALLCALPLLCTQHRGLPTVVAPMANMEGRDGLDVGSWHGSNDHMPPVRRLASAQQHPPTTGGMELEERPRAWAGPVPSGSRPRGRSAAWTLDYDACVLARPSA